MKAKLLLLLSSIVIASLQAADPFASNSDHSPTDKKVEAERKRAALDSFYEPDKNVDTKKERHSAAPPNENFASSSLENHLRQGLFEEEANQNYEKAGTHYRAVLDAYQRQRTLAASATFRLGELARKANDTTAAASSFQAVIEQFPEQEKLLQLSRENLTALGINEYDPAALSESLLELEKAVLNQTDVVEDKRKMRDNLLRSSPAMIRDDILGVNGAAGIQGLQSTLEQQVASTTTELSKMDNMIKQIDSLNADEVIRYVANLEAAGGDLKSLYPEYQTQERLLKGMLAQGLGANHLTVKSQSVTVESLYKQLQAGVVAFKDSLKLKRDSKVDELSDLKKRLQEIKDLAVNNVILMTRIQDAHKEFQTQQEMLDRMREKLQMDRINLKNMRSNKVEATPADAVRQEVVNISGFVRAPGPKPYTPGLTLGQAIAAAGGANEFGSMKRVLLQRGKTTREFDLSNLPNRGIVLQADDTIEIPEKSWFGHGLKDSDFAPSPATDAKEAEAVQ
jgi:tetratricopeptide (TPR) repeat protein